MRMTRKAEKAFKRLADHMGVPYEIEGQSVTMDMETVEVTITERYRTTRFSKALAFLARTAKSSQEIGGWGMDPEEVRQATGFIGGAASGLAGHEEVTLMRLVPVDHRR